MPAPVAVAVAVEKAGKVDLPEQEPPIIQYKLSRSNNIWRALRINASSGSNKADPLFLYNHNLFNHIGRFTGRIKRQAAKYSS